jgi:hypothetical protein
MDPNNPIFAVDPREYDDAPLDAWCDDVLARWRALPHHSMTSLLGEARTSAKAILLGSRLMPEEVADRILHILAYIYDSSAPMISLDVICYAFGIIGRNGESMARIAGRHGISRQAFSTRLKKACEDLHIRPRGSMRTMEDREKYATVQQSRWRVINQDAPV